MLERVEPYLSYKEESLSEDGEPSLLQRVMTAFEAESGLAMSFDDHTGYATGVHNDVPAMKLNRSHLHHSCEFCVLAKQTSRGHLDCQRNKLAAQRLVINRRSGLDGLCHLGLLDLAEPLIFHGRMLGVFYYGSVVVRGQEKTSRERIRRYCRRRGISPAPVLEALKRRPVIEPESIPRHRECLRTVVHLARELCESSGVDPDLYPMRAMSLPISDPHASPYVVKKAMAFVAGHISQPFRVKEIAAHLGCHPDYLSRKFKATTGVDLHTYITRLRIDRALLLLENPKLTVDQVVERAGFSDRSQFGRTFRRLTGSTPAAYRKRRTADRICSQD